MQGCKVILHVCCGPCATESIRRLKEDYSVTCYFYNPCIEPEDEWVRRKEAFVKVCNSLGVEYVVGDYDIEEFRVIVKGLEKENEGGKRCLLCYEQRLKKTMEY
ncbi:epoxyqueuosine reductase QueH, partial [Candidatus Woesearchaeota archaeon]|nr:epoxyqueuosine reductase QueH [Candidatus Woesearchaeota archaeon]